ncbi:MAG: hypothetical protein R6X02_21695 [Enhygromyxa sp.]
MLVRNHLLGTMITAAVREAEGRAVAGRRAADLLVNYDVELELRFEDDRLFLVSTSIGPSGERLAVEEQAKIGSSRHRSIVSRLDARKYGKLKEAFDLIGRWSGSGSWSSLADAALLRNYGVELLLAPQANEPQLIDSGRQTTL